MTLDQIMRIVFFVIITTIVLYLFYIFFKIIQREQEKRTRTIKVISGSKASALKEEFKGNQPKKKKKKRKNNSFKDLFKQYLFFGGTKSKLIKSFTFGYLGVLFFYLLLTRHLLISIILSFLYILAFYTILESNTKRKRLAYIKSFSSSLDIITASVHAGNSIEEAIKTITKRENIGEIIKREFTLLNNNLKSNIPLEESLERFRERNSMFEEFSMFVIVVQFFVKSGGRNVKNVFTSMQQSLNQKIENYSTIESKIVSYQFAFNAFVILEILATFIGPIFITNFYTNIASSLEGIVKVVASVVLTILSVFFFKSMIKTSAEA